MITLTLPYPPSLNHLYTIRRTGYKNRGHLAFGLSDKGRAYKTEVFYLIKQKKIQTLAGKIEVFIVAFMPDNRKRDLMNLEKIVSDSLQAAEVFSDDYQIDLFQIERGPVKKGGELFVTIKERS